MIGQEDKQFLLFCLNLLQLDEIKEALRCTKVIMKIICASVQGVLGHDLCHFEDLHETNIGRNMAKECKFDET